MIAVANAIFFDRFETHVSAARRGDSYMLYATFTNCVLSVRTGDVRQKLKILKALYKDLWALGTGDKNLKNLKALYKDLLGVGNRGGSSRPIVARRVRYGPVKQRQLRDPQDRPPGTSCVQ